MIKKYLLENTHAAIVVVKPEKGRSARLDKELDEKLQAYKEKLSKDDVQKLCEDTKQLIAYQESEDALEDLEKIPVLERKDISKEPAAFFNEELNLDGIKTVFHEIETNGIAYATLMFDISHVPEDKIAYAGILQAVLGLIDTNNYEYGELFNEINVHTGGIGTSVELYADVNKAKEKEFRTTFEIKGKALYPKIDILFKMMREILMESKLDDTKRLKEIISMLVSKLQMHFLSSGHTTAALRALSYESPLAKFKDDVEGIGFYHTLKELDDHFEEHKDEIVATLKDLSKAIFRADNLLVSYTASKEGLEVLKPSLKELANTLYKSTEAPNTTCVLHCEKKNEGFKTSSKVQYVARVGNFLDRGQEYHGALQILKVILSYDYLWQNVRVKGGAYGCMSSFNRLGEAYFMSYRDPNLRKTNEIYEGVVEYLENFTVSERDMTKYIIGTMSNIDRPMTPAIAGDRSMNLYMNRVSMDMIRKERMQILNATQEDIRALSKIVKAVLMADLICVIGGEDKIEEEKDLFMEVKPLF